MSLLVIAGSRSPQDGMPRYDIGEDVSGGSFSEALSYLLREGVTHDEAVDALNEAALTGESSVEVN